MAEEILISIAAKAAEYTVDPIRRQVSYILFYDKNMKDLEEKVKELHSIRKKANDIISKRGDQRGETYPEFIEWLNKVDDMLGNNIPQVIENENEDEDETGWDKKVFNPSCYNLAQRHQLGRRTKKELNLIIQLVAEGKEFIKDFYPRHEFECVVMEFTTKLESIVTVTSEAAEKRYDDIIIMFLVPIFFLLCFSTFVNETRS